MDDERAFALRVAGRAQGVRDFDKRTELGTALPAGDAFEPLVSRKSSGSGVRHAADDDLLSVQDRQRLVAASSASSFFMAVLLGWLGG